MGKHFIYIDDSKVAQRYMSEQFKGAFPADTLHIFSNGQEAIEVIRKMPSLPTMIFCDLLMPGFSGAMVLDEVKRDPRLHSLPVVLISSELDEKAHLDLEKNGAFQFIAKPFQRTDLLAVVDRYHSQALDLADLRSLDEGFADDSLDQLHQAKALVGCRNAEEINELYRIYHTIKGGARSLQFPELGTFVHQMESVLSAIKKVSLFSHDTVTKHLLEGNDFLIKQMSRIKELKVLESPPLEIVDALKLIVSNINAGWLTKSEPHNTDSNLNSSVKTDEGETQNATSVRIPNQKLDELQNRFKKLQQIRVKLNSFAQDLKREFSDEGFPNQLVNLVSDMEKESMGIMEFFISLRVIPAKRLKTFATHTTQQAADSLKKQISIDFSAEEGLEIDQSIVEVLEAALTHLIRNSIDHGIEIAEKRVAIGKVKNGNIKVQIVKDSRERFIMKIEDDGAGINAQKLRAIVAAKGIMPEQSLRSLPDEKIYDFIFLDGLSTKEDVTEFSGRGVGLSAVKDRILQLGGSIETKSQPGIGTSFEIRLPRVFQL